MERRRLLAVTGVSRLEGGFLLRAVCLLRELATDWDISLVEASGIDPDVIAWPDPVRHEVISIPPRSPWQPAPGRHPNRDALREAVDAVLDTRHPDVALLWIGAEYLAFGRADFPPAVGDRIDSFTLGQLRFARYARSPLKRLSALRKTARYAGYERGMVRRLETTVVAGEADAGILQRLSGSSSVRVVPSGTAVADSPDFDAESRLPTVAITGTLNHPPNVDAAVRFVRDIWPDVRREIPNARLLVAGRSPSDKVRLLAEVPGVELREDVPDMLTVLQESWLAVAPMRYGSGIKTKVLEAWGAGRPAVLTPIATSGLALDEAMRDLVAADRRDFGATVLGLLRDPERRHMYGRAAHALAVARHSWSRCGRAMSEILRTVAESRPARP